MGLDRRQFVTWSAGGALVLALRPTGARAEAGALSPWIRIAPDGRITLYSTVSEMGQGAKTGQAQVLADELDAPWDQITVEMGAFSPSGPFAQIGTGGSSSIRAHWKALRLAGASVRCQLVSAAAKRWSCPESDCIAELGQVRRTGTGATFGYGELAEDAATCAAPAVPPFKAAAQRRYIGKPLATLENADKSTGRARYGIDVRVPGMLRATVVAAPAFGARLASVDEAPAMAISGVKQVVRLDNAVAVVAGDTWTAFKGARALKPAWTAPPIALGAGEIMDKLFGALDGPDADVSDAKARAGLRADLAKAPRKVEATYATAPLAHAAMEPMNATAQVTATQVEVWVPTQLPTAARAIAARAAGRPVGQVALHTTLLGGGFGRRLMQDFVTQAVSIAKATGGAPVQLVWTREEDVSHDFYRRATVSKFRAGLRPDGLIDGYEAVSAGADESVGHAGPEPYGFTRFAATQSEVRTGIPQGPWRSVDPGLSAFGRESFIDECAHAAGIDPLAYRRALIGDNPRVRRLIDAAAKGIGWGGPKAAGVGRGLALVQSFNSLVATGIEVEAKDKKLAARRIFVAADVGTAVNPQQVKAQFEGGALMGLSAALGEAMTFTGGKADQANFNTYKLLRMRQAPPVEVVLFDSPDAELGGAGEPGVPGIAPALANAVFDATGDRVRALPFSARGYSI